MYKTICILIISIFLNGIQAQPFGDASNNYKIIKLDYTNSSGEIGTTYFQYGQTDKIIKALWTLKDKSRYSNNYYEYNFEGKLISAFRDFSDGLTSYELYNYDPDGKKISEYFYRSDSVSGYATYTYKNDYLAQADFNKYKGWLSGILKIQYNKDNKKETAQLYQKDQTISNITYTYDENGNLTTEYWDFNGKWNQTFNYIYEKKVLNEQFYSSPFLTHLGNNKILEENYTYNNETGGPSAYYYSKDGLLEKKVFIRSDGLTTNTYYKYDDQRKLISSKRIYSDGSIANFTYIYDENDNLINRNFYKSDSLFGFESYLYNSDGILEKAYFKNFDGWLTGTISFESNNLGKVERGNFFGENGFDASIHFNYNDNSLLSEIVWDFSFGKFQKYSFQYESVP